MKKAYQDRIDDYLLDRMTKEERHTFEKEIENNDELQEQLEFTEKVQRAMKKQEWKIVVSMGYFFMFLT